MADPGKDPPNRSDESDRSATAKRLRPSGGYRKLRSFGVATIVYDATVSFCDRFIDRRSRTHDQMVQAARSGARNIAEGSRDSGGSSQTEIRLVTVARGSLDELLLDYEDFLRQHHLRQWDKDDPEAREVRDVGQASASNRSDPADPALATAYSRWLDHADPAVVANALLCLINQANYLLDQQLRRLERDFITGGGYSEQLAAARLAYRQQQADRSDQPDQPRAPACPTCGQPMVLRTARQGPNAGSQFWGCSAYPRCKATLPVG